MKDILNERFSHIVTWENTEVITITAHPDTEEEVIQTGVDFIDKFKPSDCDYDHGLTIRETPDGELSEHVIIWHAKWKNEKGAILPLIVAPSTQ